MTYSNMKHYIIGCGGVGTWVTPAAIRLFNQDRFTVMDGDDYEEKNLDRQLFNNKDIGRNKADALADLYDISARPEYFSLGKIEFEPDTLLWVCVDNHAARREALESCDLYNCTAVLGSNETTSASALWYEPEWRDTHRDPRIRYPEITSDRTGDPRARQIGCIVQIDQGNRQLVSANLVAASLMAQLAVVWKMEALKFSTEDRLAFLPYELQINLSSAVALRGEKQND